MEIWAAHGKLNVSKAHLIEIQLSWRDTKVVSVVRCSIASWKSSLWMCRSSVIIWIFTVKFKKWRNHGQQMIATEYNHTLCLGSPADVITPSMLLQQMRLYEDDKTERHNFQMMHFILICLFAFYWKWFTSWVGHNILCMLLKCTICRMCEHLNTPAFWLFPYVCNH